MHRGVLQAWWPLPEGRGGLRGACPLAPSTGLRAVFGNTVKAVGVPSTLGCWGRCGQRQDCPSQGREVSCGSSFDRSASRLCSLAVGLRGAVARLRAAWGWQRGPCGVSGWWDCLWLPQHWWALPCCCGMAGSKWWAVWVPLRPWLWSRCAAHCWPGGPLTWEAGSCSQCHGQPAVVGTRPAAKNLFGGWTSQWIQR